MATESKTAVANALTERLADAHARWDAPAVEGSSIYNLQRDAFEKFIHQGIPTTRNEEWKYTPLESFLKHDYTVANVSDFDVTRYDKSIVQRVGVEDFKSSGVSLDSKKSMVFCAGICLVPPADCTA